jgi:S-adenosylmethionine uptake transporter
MTLQNTLNNFYHSSWFFKKGYFQGVFWANMISISSVLNDAIMCGVSQTIPVVEVTFFRFFFSTLVLLPFLSFTGIKNLKTTKLKLHIIRILLGATALWLGCLSLSHITMSQNTTIMFIQPLFFLPLAYIFLNEHVGYTRIIATIFGFLGLVYLIQPGTDHFSVYSFIPILAAFIFAVLDVITKKMVTTENTILLLFYFGVGSTILTLPFALYYFKQPSITDYLLLFLLGVGANLIQVFLFLAFKATEASALGPFRYVELIFSLLIGYCFFHQVPSQHMFFGAAIIILSTLYLSYMENKSSSESKTLPL